MSGKYGTISTTGKPLHKEEPVFLVLATDPLAVTTIMLYKSLAEVAGCSLEFRDEIIALAKAVELWQHDHPTLVKPRPD